MDLTAFARRGAELRLEELRKEIAALEDFLAHPETPVAEPVQKPVRKGRVWTPEQRQRQSRLIRRVLRERRKAA